MSATTLRQAFIVTLLLAVPVIGLAEGPASLAPFPTVAQLTAAIRANTAAMKKQDFGSRKLSTPQAIDQAETIDREWHYWYGAWEIAKQERDADQRSIKADPSLLTAIGRETAEAVLTQDREECDQLLADRELIREQQNLRLGHL